MVKDALVLLCSGLSPMLDERDRCELRAFLQNGHSKWGLCKVRESRNLFLPWWSRWCPGSNVTGGIQSTECGLELCFEPPEGAAELVSVVRKKTVFLVFVYYTIKCVGLLSITMPFSILTDTCMARAHPHHSHNSNSAPQLQRVASQHVQRDTSQRTPCNNLWISKGNINY